MDKITLSLATFSLATYNKPIAVEAVEVVPGIAVHRVLNWDRRTKLPWTLTHIASGKRIVGPFRLQEQAIACAQALAPLADWTDPGPGITARQIGPQVKQAYLDAAGLR